MPDPRDSQGDASTELGMSSDVPTEPVVDLAKGRSVMSAELSLVRAGGKDYGWYVGIPGVLVVEVWCPIGATALVPWAGEDA